MKNRFIITISVIFTLLSIWVAITPYKIVRNLNDQLENLAYDFQLKSHMHVFKQQVKAPLVIIEIDERSLAKEGRWPWSHAKVAELVTKLRAIGATGIVLDILFGEPEENIVTQVMQELRNKQQLTPALAHILDQNKDNFDYDKRLAEALGLGKSVLALAFLPEGESVNVLPVPILQLQTPSMQGLNFIKATSFISNIPVLQAKATGSGFINIIADNDGLMRRAPLLMRYENNLYPSLAFQTALIMLDAKVSLVTHYYGDQNFLEGVQIGSHFIPTDAKGQAMIPYIGPSHTFKYYSATDILNDKIPPGELKNKFALVGFTATGFSDLQATSIQASYPGVEIQASLINGIFADNFSYTPAWALGANVCLIIIIGLLSAFVFPNMNPNTLSLFVFIIPVASFFLNHFLWYKTGLVLPIFIPILLLVNNAIINIIFGYYLEAKRRKKLRTMFGQYVPEQHIIEMIKNGGNGFSLRGENREMTVLFADIRSFTSLSENKTASEMVEFLNTFFTPMTEIIFKYHGTIDKYVGDLIMAFWGAPLKDKDHALNSLETALAMQKKLASMQETFAQSNWPIIRIGIGINTGNMSVGDMGSAYRRNYTVLGDAVNVASRVESLTKFYDVNIIVTEATQANQQAFVFRKLDRVKVRGKQEVITIYELIGKIDEVSEEVKQELALFHQAQSHYYNQQWQTAQQIFEQLNTLDPKKLIYRIYLNRIQIFKDNPLGPNWDGSYKH
jgi:adenylate cyclase